jgi:hypothetical protein
LFIFLVSYNPVPVYGRDAGVFAVDAEREEVEFGAAGAAFQYMALSV